MKRLLYVLLIATFAAGFIGCSKDAAEETAATGIQPSQPARGANSTAPARPAVPTTPAAPKPAAKPDIPTAIAVPEGTELSVLLIDSISTGKNKAGDQFLASLAEPILVNGKPVVDRGTRVQGQIVDAEGSGRVSGKANIRLVLTGILDGAKTYPIETRPFAAEAESTRGRDAKIIGGAAGIGAAIGASAGGKKGALEGAAIGGGAGTRTVLMTKGKEVEFGSETKLKFTLDKSVQLPKIVSKSS